MRNREAHGMTYRSANGMRWSQMESIICKTINVRVRVRRARRFGVVARPCAPAPSHRGRGARGS